MSANLRRGAVWVLVLCLILYRAFHMPPNVADRIRAALTTHWALWVSVAIWIVFSIYWEIEAKNAARDRSGESTASRVLHVSLVNAALLLLYIPVPGLNGRYLPAALTLLGLAIQTGGVLLAIWARRHLGRNWSGRVTLKVDHELVRTGPYRFVRHPIYTALLAMYAGGAVVSGEWHAVVGIVLVSLAYWRKIRIEEANLAGGFGATWDDYRRSTRALVPGLF